MPSFAILNVADRFNALEHHLKIAQLSTHQNSFLSVNKQKKYMQLR